VRGFVFSEEIIKQKIAREGEEKIGGILFRPTSIALTYGEAVPDYDQKIVRLKTHATVTSESVVDRDTLLDKILGKDESDINTFRKSRRSRLFSGHNGLLLPSHLQKLA